MIFLTDFADQAVVLPVVLAVAVSLGVLGCWRGMLTWLGVIGVTFGAILVLKLGFLACAPVFGPWSLHSPSGHTAAASMVAGGMAALLTGRRFFVLPVATLAAVVIGISRLALGFHSWPEVLTGAAVGIAGAAVLSRLAGPRPRGRWMPLLMVAGAVAVMLHGMRLPAETAIWRVSQGMLDVVPACRGDAAVGPV
jgi:membrane-associated phospholipid phosphatase